MSLSLTIPSGCCQPLDRNCQWRAVSLLIQSRNPSWGTVTSGWCQKLFMFIHYAGLMGTGLVLAQAFGCPNTEAVPYPCFRNPSQRGKLADLGLFWPKVFPQSSYPQYWDCTAQPLAPRAMHISITSGFFSGKNLLLAYSFQSLSVPIQYPGTGGHEMAAIAMLVMKRTDLLGQPCVSLMLLHFIFCASKFPVFTLVTWDSR